MLPSTRVSSEQKLLRKNFVRNFAKNNFRIFRKRTKCEKCKMFRGEKYSSRSDLPFSLETNPRLNAKMSISILIWTKIICSIERGFCRGWSLAITLTVPLPLYFTCVNGAKCFKPDFLKFLLQLDWNRLKNNIEARCRFLFKRKLKKLPLGEKIKTEIKGTVVSSSDVSSFKEGQVWFTSVTFYYL